MHGGLSMLWTLYVEWTLGCLGFSLLLETLRTSSLLLYVYVFMFMGAFSHRFT